MDFHRQIYPIFIPSEVLSCFKAAMSRAEFLLFDQDVTIPSGRVECLRDQSVPQVMLHHSWQLSSYGPLLDRMWAWIKEWYPSLLPATVNVLLVLAGIFLSSSELIGKIERNPIRKWVFALAFIVLGAVGFVYEATERHHSEKGNRILMNNVQQTLDQTNSLLREIGDVKTNVSSIPLLTEEMKCYKNQLFEAEKEHDTAKQAEYQKKLLEAQAAKMVLLKQVISNAKLVVSQLRYTAQNWSSEEAHAKDDKERDRIHGEWNHRNPLGNARPTTLQLLALLPETLDRSKEIQSQDMKFHGQAFGGTGPGPIQEDADYLDALIQRVIAANPELAQ
jgi:hypothetical protein